MNHLLINSKSNSKLLIGKILTLLNGFNFIKVKLYNITLYNIKTKFNLYKFLGVFTKKVLILI